MEPQKSTMIDDLKKWESFYLSEAKQKGTDIYTPAFQSFFTSKKLDKLIELMERYL